MKNFKFWINWIKTIAGLTVLMGLFMFVTSVLPKNQPSAMDNEINIAFFEIPESIPQELLNFQSWHYAVGSSMLISWGLIILMLTHNALAKKEKWAWYTIFTALLAWFVFDQFASSYFHVTFNVIFNGVFFLLYFIPLMFIKPRLKVA